MNDSLKRHKDLQTLLYDFRSLKKCGSQDLIRLLEAIATRFAREVEIQG